MRPASRRSGARASSAARERTRAFSHARSAQAAWPKGPDAKCRQRGSHAGAVRCAAAAESQAGIALRKRGRKGQLRRHRRRAVCSAARAARRWGVRCGLAPRSWHGPRRPVSSGDLLAERRVSRAKSQPRRQTAQPRSAARSLANATASALTACAARSCATHLLRGGASSCGCAALCAAEHTVAKRRQWLCRSLGHGGRRCTASAAGVVLGAHAAEPRRNQACAVRARQ